MLVKTSIEVAGFRGSRKGLAIVDTGASLTLLDEIVAGDIGVRMTGRELSLTDADGHEVKGLLAIIDKLRVEDEELPGAHVAVISFPERLRNRLSMLNVDNWVILVLSKPRLSRRGRTFTQLWSVRLLNFLLLYYVPAGGWGGSIYG